MLQRGSMSVLEYTTKFEELCKFSTIYQHDLDEGWKYIKFEGSLREDILASVRLMEIEDYAALANKSRLESNKKLATAKAIRDIAKKRLAFQDQGFEDAPYQETIRTWWQYG